MDKRSKKRNNCLKKSLNSKKSKNIIILKLKYDKNENNTCKYKDFNKRKHIFTYMPNNNVFIY